MTELHGVIEKLRYAGAKGIIKGYVGATPFPSTCFALSKLASSIHPINKGLNKRFNLTDNTLGYRTTFF